MNQYSHKYKRNNIQIYKEYYSLKLKGIVNFDKYFTIDELRRLRISLCKCGNWKTEYSRQCRGCRLKEWNKILGKKKKIQYIGKGNNRFGIKHTVETKRKIKMSNKNVKIVEHHKYLKENSDIKIKMSPSNHSLLHQNVYKYLYIKYGKQGVDSYLKWFNKNIRRIL